MQGEAIEALGADGSRLRVEFVRQHDRYLHVVSRIDAHGRAAPVVESIEGSPTDDWPPSPPLQTLSIEQLPDGRRVAMLLGMAGHAHWSVSIEPLAGEAKLVVDVACRHATKPASLGSRYRHIGARAGRSWIESENAKLCHGDEFTEIVPLVLNDKGTTRWRYVLSTEY